MNEIPVPIKGQEFVDQAGDYQHLKMTAAWK
jgi:hypothetical protein